MWPNVTDLSDDEMNINVSMEVEVETRTAVCKLGRSLCLNTDVG